MGVDLLIIEHNMDVVMKLSDRITVISFGRKIAEGTPEEIKNNDDVISAYLGARFKKNKGGLHMLKIDNISVSYGQVKALLGVSIEVNDGEIVSIIGSNGAGKSSLMRSIVGDVKVQSGKSMMAIPI